MIVAPAAVVKALGLEVMRPLEIEVVGGGTAGVGVRLHGTTAAEAGARQVEISFTHTRGMAGAVAMVAGA